MIQPDAIPGCIGRSHRKRDSAGGSKGERGRTKSDVRGRGEGGGEGGRSRLPLCSL